MAQQVIKPDDLFDLPLPWKSGRKQTSQTCLLTSTCVLWHVHPSAHTILNSTESLKVEKLTIVHLLYKSRPKPIYSSEVVYQCLKKTQNFSSY